MLAATWLLLGSAAAVAFDYASYKPADLDAFAAKKPSGPGVDIYPVKKYAFDATLVARAAPCRNNFLKREMLSSGIDQSFIDTVPITKCIQVKSAKGRKLSVYIQDALADSFAKEVPPGGRLTLYGVVIYVDQTGPGIIANDFKNTVADCGCGKDFHSGTDFSAPVGSPVPAMDDGVIVRIEQDETADVDVPSAGKCGRYVVVKHSHADGHIAYSRYAQLGRLVGNDDKPLTVGQQIKARDKIGEVGRLGRFHFEIRPADDAAMDQSPKWTQLYGADVSMAWSRYQPVDPQKFHYQAFGGKKDKAATSKN